MTETRDISCPYRALFVGTLVQESFLSMGGSDDPLTTVDSPFCRDGLQRPLLRGSGLAGALVATLRQLRGPVPPEISGSKDGAESSVWRFYHSHCEGPAPMAYRQHVAINHRTGAAEDGALFNVETLPPGTRWSFLLEVDTRRQPSAADLARDALAQWQQGRCFLGREVARGMGWLRLQGLQEYQLQIADADQWPHAEAADRYPDYLAETFAERRPNKPPNTAPTSKSGEWGCCIKLGPRADGYGLDSLSIGGHSSAELMAEWHGGYLAPSAMKEEENQKAFDPDFAVVTVGKGAEAKPYIPGSSLRGVLRHGLERHLRRQQLGEDKIRARVDGLFGTTEASARLLIRDALPVEGETFPMAWMQHHAEDEFSGGSYGASRFDRIAVLSGSFETRLVLEASPEEAATRQTDLQDLQWLMAYASSGQLGLGGGQWRGHGWVNWSFDPPPTASANPQPVENCK